MGLSVPFQLKPFHVPMCIFPGGKRTAELEQGARNCFLSEICAGWAASSISSLVSKQGGKKHPKFECQHLILAEDPQCCVESPKVLAGR